MKINFKNSLSILAVSFALFFQGCGGGTTNPDSNNPDSNNPDSNNPGTDGPIGGTDNKYKYNRISIAGSSITWANGMMGNGDYIAPVEKYFRENIATTIMPNTLNSNASLILDDMSYNSRLYKYVATSEISGSISGDEISIAFAAQRGATNVVVEMIVDEKSLGEKTIVSNPVLHRMKTFSGNGSIRSFDLGEAHTFNHNVDGNSNGFILETDYIPTVDFGISDWAIIRKSFNGPNSAVHHFITFKNPPSGSFTVNYDYGENIKPVESSVDNVERLIGSPRESVYGDLWTSNLSEALKPINGLDFRQNNEKAVKTWKLDSDGVHSFTLKVKSGELLLNFITNHMYLFQNAGIGGTSAATLKVQTGTTGTIEKIREFDPDLFIFESSTNDAGDLNRFGAEFAGSSNNWEVYDAGFTKTATNQIVLDSSYSIQIGDVIEMGSYNGDINNIAVGIVSNWNSSSRKVTFTTDISNYNGNTCAIKSIIKWENNVQAVVDKVTANVNHNIKVGIATCGVPNLYERRLMGYREKGKMLADKSKNNWLFFDFFEATLGENWSTDNAHANTILGQQLFGKAITDVLFP